MLKFAQCNQIWCVTRCRIRTAAAYSHEGVLASTLDFSRIVGGVQYMQKNHLLRKTRGPAVFSESCGLFSLASYATALCNGRRTHWPNHVGRWMSGRLSFVCAQVHWMRCHCVFLVIRQSFIEVGIYYSYSEIIFTSLVSCLSFTWTCVVFNRLSIFVRCDFASRPEIMFLVMFF